jgi:hypothetical protein
MQSRRDDRQEQPDEAEEARSREWRPPLTRRPGGANGCGKHKRRGARSSWLWRRKRRRPRSQGETQGADPDGVYARTTA